MEMGKFLVTDEYVVTVKDNEEDYFYALKDREPLYCSISVLIHRNSGKGKKGEHLVTYSNRWVEKVPSSTIYNFIRNILEKPECREKYRVDGEDFKDVIQYTHESGVNKKCYQAIQRFYKIKPSNRKFRDYANLKTFGIDKFSRLKKEALYERSLKVHIDEVEKAFEDEKDIASTLKWILRGLECEDAIRKTKTDLEIASNIRR